MSTKTLFFEEIAPSGTVFNKDTIANYPTGHANANGGYVSVQYKKGDYGQTEGNIFGDNLPNTPACAYHMPRNNKRFTDPRLNVQRKDAGAIIEARDINDLIDRIKLYSYVWEAEANNIYGLPGVTGRSNSPVSITNLKYVNAKAGIRSISQPPHIILDGSRDPKIVVIEKVPTFVCVQGTGIRDTREKLLYAASINTKSGISFGSPNPFGFVSTDDNKVPGYYDIDTISTSKVLNFGHWPVSGAKFVQSETNKEEFHIRFVGGPLSGEFAKDQDGEVLNFKTGIPYIQSYLPTNEIGMDLHYNGFMLYWYNPIKDLIPTTLGANTTTRTESPVVGIGNYGHAAHTLAEAMTHTITIPDPTPSGGTTPEINYDIATTINNIPVTLTDPTTTTEILGNSFWNDIYSGYVGFAGMTMTATKAKTALMKSINVLPTKVLHIPRQKIIGIKSYRETTPGNWVEQHGIYSIDDIQLTLKNSPTYDSGLLDGMGGDLNPLVCFNISASKWDPVTKERISSSIISTAKKVGRSGWIDVFEYDNSFFVDPLGWLEANQSVFGEAAQELKNGFYFTMNNFLFLNTLTGYDETGPVYRNIYFDEAGNGYEDKIISGWLTSYPVWSYAQDTRFYTIGETCSDGSPIGPDGMCTVTTVEIPVVEDLIVPVTVTKHGNSYYNSRLNGTITGVDGYPDCGDYFGLPGTATRHVKFFKNGVIYVNEEYRYGTYYVHLKPNTASVMGTGDILIGEDTTTVTIREYDITYSKENYFIGSSLYPYIKGSDYKNIKNVINAYLQSILVLAQTGKNNGIGDADTITEIGAWNVAQLAGSSVFNKDDPDSSFYGYHAESTGIVKLDFYNVLVDAYKLMINSCICNANCTCNLVCSCNTNCGCNYSG